VKRLPNTAGVLLGLLALGVLAVVLILTFGGLWSGPWRSSQAFSSPTQPSYPLPGTPGSPLVKPTPVTPPPTIPPKPLVSPELRGTVTVPPYPPPQTPVSTAVPLPATATPIPRVTVVPGPLPPGLKIVCAEEWVDERLIVIWMANVDDLVRVQIIARLPNRVPMSSLGGYISPDGRQLAYILPGKYLELGTLGIMNIDGTGNRILDAPVLGWGTEMNVIWSPDSQWIVYQQHIPPQGEGSAETKTWLIHPDGTGKRLIPTAPSIDPWLVGWSRDSTQIYYNTGKELWSVNVEGKSQPIERIRFDPPAYMVRLSPDGQKILYLAQETRPGAPLTLGVMSLDGKEKHVVVEHVNPCLFAFENYQLHPIWSPDSTRVLYNAMVDSRHVEMRAVRWDTPAQATAIRSQEEVYCYPVSWSPDGKFTATFRYPLDTDPSREFYLALLGLDGNIQRIYGIRPDSPLPGFIGWLGSQERGRP